MYKKDQKKTFDINLKNSYTKLLILIIYNLFYKNLT